MVFEQVSLKIFIHSKKPLGVLPPKEGRAREKTQGVGGGGIETVGTVEGWTLRDDDGEPNQKRHAKRILGQRGEGADGGLFPVQTVQIEKDHLLRDANEECGRTDDGVCQLPQL
jgi:hypothetical protein